MGMVATVGMAATTTLLAVRSSPVKRKREGSHERSSLKDYGLKAMAITTATTLLTVESDSGDGAELREEKSTSSMSSRRVRTTQNLG